MLWHLGKDTHELGVPAGWSPGEHSAREAVWPAFPPKGGPIVSSVGSQKSRTHIRLSQVKMRSVL